MKNYTICPAPWMAAEINPDGIVKPCTTFLASEEFNKSSHVNIDFLNSEQWKNIRHQMSQGQTVQGCERCYQKESLGIKSTRQVLTEWFTIPDEPKIKFLDLAFSNLCNLACVGCGSDLSSKWASEDAKHGRTIKIKSLRSHKFDLKNLDLSNLEVLKLLGGEPLLEQNKFIELLERTNLKNLQLTMTTNGTNLINDRLRSLIEKCKNVIIFFSIDGEGKVNEWSRWPTKVYEVNENIQTYRHWWSNCANIKLASHTTINSYNIWTLGDFISQTKETFPNWLFDFDWVEYPNWLSISNIPKSYKNELVLLLSKWNEDIKEPWMKDVNPFTSSIEQLDRNNSSTWEEFIVNSYRLEKERNLNLLEMIPSLKGKI